MRLKDIQRLIKIAETGDKLTGYLEIKKINPKDVLEDVLEKYDIQWTITTPLYNIGEQTYQLSSELKEQYKEISWKKIAGLRHRLIHDYEGINWSIVNNVIFYELPIFIDRVK